MKIINPTKLYKIFSKKEGYQYYYSSDFSYDLEEGKNILERVQELSVLESPPSVYVLAKSFSSRLDQEDIDKFKVK